MTVKVGYVILAHHDPLLVARLAKLLIANAGVVAIHYDLKANAQEFAVLESELKGHEGRIVWPRRVRVGWGEWSIVQATLNAVEALAASGEVLDFVHLMSGSDYPIRPLSDFQSYLRRHQETEFIECVDMISDSWVTGGLTHERYQYRHYFNWKSHSALFGKCWGIQKRLGLARSFPRGLRPTLGSQWWTLSWRAVELVLAAGRDRRLTSFFQTVWIPDEMFIQSVVASATFKPVTAPNLTLYQFTDKGLPVVYYNDHTEYLARQPFFFARKMSRCANHLRDTLDAHVNGTDQVTEFSDEAFGRRTEEYRNHQETWGKPRAGTRLLGYEKNNWMGDLVYQEAPIVAVFGASHKELRMIAELLNQTGHVLCHGALFHPDRIEFAEDVPSYAGYASDQLALRDNRRTNFLRDVAREVNDDVVGFLAPWTMDEGIRDRLVWSKFSKILIVRGNLMCAFEENCQRARALPVVDASLREGQAASHSKMITVEDFIKFEAEHSDYYTSLRRTLEEAKSSFDEIDLMVEGWPQKLIEFLQRSGVVPQTLSPPRATAFASAVVGWRPASPSTNHIPNAINLIKSMRDQDRRFAHLKDYSVGTSVEMPHLFVAILGASIEEIKFVGNILEHLGVIVCHGALFAPDRIEFAGDVSRYAGYREDDVTLRDADRVQFLSAVVQETEENFGGRATAFVAPWREIADGADDFSIWHDFSRILIVRGNVARAFIEQRDRRMGERFPGQARGMMNRSENRKFFDSYCRYYGDICRDCEEAQADFKEIDLMQTSWLFDLLRFFESHNLPDDKDVRAHIMRRAELLSDPFSNISDPFRLINIIDDRDRRAAHLSALRESRSERGLVADAFRAAGNPIRLDRRER